MTTTINNEHKKLNAPNKREQNQTCLDSAEREGLRPKGNVPNLRFPEFHGEWEKCRLGDVCTFLSGGTPKIDIKEYWNGTIPFVSAISMHDTYILDSKLHISEEGLKHGSRLLTKDNLLLLVRGSMLWNTIPICLNKNDVAFNQDVKGIIANDTINKEFLLYWLKSKEQRLKYMVTGTGLGAGKLDTSDLLSMIVYIPAMKEQDKVARLLSLFDERIATQNKIIEDLKKLKSAISENLFKAVNGDVVILSEICEIIKGKQINSEFLSEKGKYYVMNGGTEPSGYYSDYNVEANTISISEGGNSCGYVQFNTSPFWSGGHCYTIQKIADNVDHLYLYHYLKSKEDAIMKLRIGSGLPNIQKKDLAMFKIKLPTVEQQKSISTFLSSLERKAEIEEMLLNAMKKEKQYLLRQMFI